MEMGTLGWIWDMWGHWDGYGAIGMDMGTWGWIWGHWNVYRAIGMAMGPSGRLWDVRGQGGRGAIGMAEDSPGRPRGPQPDGQMDRWTAGRTAGRTDRRPRGGPTGGCAP